MTTPADYYDFADECLRWARHAKNASDRATLIATARLWTEIALRIEPHVIAASNQVALAKDLRAKLN